MAVAFCSAALRSCHQALVQIQIKFPPGKDKPARIRSTTLTFTLIVPLPAGKPVTSTFTSPQSEEPAGKAVHEASAMFRAAPPPFGVNVAETNQPSPVTRSF